jgi:predicted metal-binding membrane protein
MTGAAEAVLRRHRGVTIAGLVAVTALAWAWIASGAGLEMEAGMGMDMPMAWDAERVSITLAMWWAMMVAMMVPAAAPTVLLYARSARPPHSGAFLAGYLLCWLGFSIAAVALQFALEEAGRLTHMDMALSSRWLAGGLLIAAGLYQFTRLKGACLAHCRSPAHWLSSHYRAGRAGALRMGLSHGAFCVGCCWMLMLLLFVVGVMNLAWIAALTLLVAAEKLLPRGQWIARIGGAATIAWGILTLAA